MLMPVTMPRSEMNKENVQLINWLREESESNEKDPPLLAVDDNMTRIHPEAGASQMAEKF